MKILTILMLMLVSALAFSFDRRDYGVWADLDHDCINTRNEILIRDSQTTPIKTKCKVSYGKWVDPYSGKVFLTPSGIDVDHIIPLKYADDHGGKNWHPARKIEFGNDPDNLLAVSMSQNRSKGDKGPYNWMPQNKAFHCQYAKSWKAIAEKYRINVDTFDRMRIKVILTMCK